MSFGGSHVQTAVQDRTDPVPPASLGLIAAGPRDSPIATNELDRNFRPLRQHSCLRAKRSWLRGHDPGSESSPVRHT